MTKFFKRFSCAYSVIFKNTIDYIYIREEGYLGKSLFLRLLNFFSSKKNIFAGRCKYMYLEIPLFFNGETCEALSSSPERICALRLCCRCFARSTQASFEEEISGMKNVYKKGNFP